MCNQRLADYRLGHHVLYRYCLRVHETEPESRVFLILLRIYLVPRETTTGGLTTAVASPPPVLVEPALALIGRHSTKLDPVEVIPLLPPLLSMAEVSAFFKRTLIKAASDHSQGRVVAQVANSRKETLDWKLLRLQDRRVRIAETRLLVPSLVSYSQ